MKLKTFLRKLSNVTLVPEMTFDGAIRFQLTDNILLCPITAVLNEKTGDVVSSMRWGVAYEAGTNRDLKLSSRDAKAIIFAADKLKGYSKKLRAQLLEACELEGE